MLDLQIIIVIVIIIIEKVRQCTAGESDFHPISPKTSAPQYQPIERNRKQSTTKRASC